MAQYEFKSESKRLLDLMIHSIYTHKEIFLRELISNASDALDKLYYQSLKDESITFDRENFFIRLTPDAQNRTLTILDRGIGMDKAELEEHLGTIAKSGSFAFKNETEKTEDVDIIGQFGVGFYSAFMVAKKVEVKSRKFGATEAYLWTSSGADGYDITPSSMEYAGTEITLYLKEDSEEETYGEFLQEYTLRNLVKKYSDYIKYPIKMQVTRQKLKETEENAETPEYETYIEDETLNSMVPLWRRTKSELTDEDYNNFYQEKFFDFEAPQKVIHTSADGAVSYQALLFLPKRPPFDYYTKEFKKGLQLYANGVMIMEKCEDLLPDYFGFVRGLVDSQDLSLNISREMLQHDRQLKIIANHLKKKIKNELLAMQKNDREAYEAFYENFKRPLKFGMYDNYGAEKDFLVDLIMFVSSKEKKPVTLKEYTERMKEDQNVIYYACGESISQIEALPRCEMVKEKGYEVLYFTEDVDEFAIKILGKFMDKEFQSVTSADMDADETTKAKDAVAQEKHKDLLAKMKEALGDRVHDVKISTALKNHPVCMSTEGEISLEMEKTLSAMPGGEGVKAQRVLEINAEHSVFSRLEKADADTLNKLSLVLYNCALLLEGLSIDDAATFVDSACDLM